MKIIAVDNFDREIYDDQLVCENICKAHGIRFLELLNADIGPYSQWAYRLVEDDYKLFVFEP